MTRQSADQRGRRDSERGAILLQVAIGGVVLLAFTMFVVDYGMLWVARRQAQNAADAGALAGAVALALDNDDQSTDNGPAKTAAYNFAISNAVLGDTPVVNDPTAGDATDVMFYKDNPAKFPAECKDGACIRVDVHRNQARGKSIPAWFGGLVGVTDYGVRATATAMAGIGDTTDCLKPWAVVDKWDEYWANNMPTTPAETPWTTASTFDKYAKRGELDPDVGTPDVYIPPTTTSTGSGFYPFNPDGTNSPWYGTQLTLKNGGANDQNWDSGWFMALDLADSKGGRDYRDNIKGCVGVDYSIGQDLEFDTEQGNMVGPTKDGVEYLIDLDKKAVWNDSTKTIDNSDFAISPRIVPVPLVNPDAIAGALKTGGKTTVKISNIMGFFIEGYLNGPKGGVQGRLVSMPGLKASGASAISPSSAWLRVIQLIR